MKVPKGGYGFKVPYSCKAVAIVEEVIPEVQEYNNEVKTLLMEGRNEELQELREEVIHVLRSRGTHGGSRA